MGFCLYEPGRHHLNKPLYFVELHEDSEDHLSVVTKLRDYLTATTKKNVIDQVCVGVAIIASVEHAVRVVKLLQ